MHEKWQGVNLPDISRELGAADGDLFKEWQRVMDITTELDGAMRNILTVLSEKAIAEPNRKKSIKLRKILAQVTSGQTNNVNDDKSGIGEG